MESHDISLSQMVPTVLVGRVLSVAENCIVQYQDISVNCAYDVPLIALLYCVLNMQQHIGFFTCLMSQA